MCLCKGRGAKGRAAKDRGAKGRGAQGRALKLVDGEHVCLCPASANERVQEKNNMFQAELIVLIGQNPGKQFRVSQSPNKASASTCIATLLQPCAEHSQRLTSKQHAAAALDPLPQRQTPLWKSLETKHTAQPVP